MAAAEDIVLMQREAERRRLLSLFSTLRQILIGKKQKKLQPRRRSSFSARAHNIKQRVSFFPVGARDILVGSVFLFSPR
jgi:hypothetical protein